MSRDATADDIKRAYRRLARQLHPDTNPDPAADGAVQGGGPRLRGALGSREAPSATTASAPTASARAPVGFGGGGHQRHLRRLLRRRRAPSGAADGGGRWARHAAPTSRWSPSCASRRRCSASSTPVDGAHRGGVRDLRGDRRQAGHAADHVPRVRGRRPGAAGAPVVPGADGHELGVPALRRPGPGHQRPVRRLPGRGPHGRGAHLHRRHPRRRRHRLHAAPHAGGARPAPAAAAHGDLYVHVRVQPHERFTRDGVDLHCDLPISFAQAALGAHLVFATLDGDRGPRDPPGHADPAGSSASGAAACPHLERRSRGDLIVRARRRRSPTTSARRRRSSCAGSPSCAATRWRPPTPGSCPASAPRSAERRSHPADHPGPLRARRGPRRAGR